MINLKKIKDLDIAKNQFDFSKDIKEPLDYFKWVKYINKNNDIFIWFEDTENGKNILIDIDKVPNDFKESTLILLNKIRCFAEFNSKKNIYEISLGCSKNNNEKVAISFNRIPTEKDLRIFLDMANYLDALLLNNGTEIINESTIESLKNKKLMSRDELIELGHKIKTCEDREKLAVMIDLFNENVPHPDGARLFIYPENYDKHGSGYLTYNPTVEEVVDKALSYKEDEEL